MSGIVVGNDVVDLADPRCVGKSQEGRFVGRILADEEARLVAGSSRPDVLLWLLWGAKEAAYKVASKLRRRPPPFNHARFRVRFAGRAGPGLLEGPGPGPRGRVAWEELELPFRASVQPERIHVLSWSPQGEPDPREMPPGISSGVQALPEEGPAEDWRAGLADRFTEREWGAIHAWPSALVRLEARAELARRLDVDQGRLQIVCPGDAPGRTPPEVLLDGDETPADVSLSHHRRFVAWAVAV